jgi:ribosomal protein L11 methylase PrmA
MRHKEEAVGRFLTSLQPSELTVHDLGANDGRFSRIATKLGFTVVSQDIDPVAVEKNYLQVKRNKGENLLPLQLDLTNPSPAIGWSLAERMSFTERVNGKIVLALAIVHHMAISNNVPMKLIAKHFADLASYLIIEFVPKSDSQAKRLLSSRKDIFDDYTKEKFEEDFSQFFSFRHRENITGSERTLYLMAKK